MTKRDTLTVAVDMTYDEAPGPNQMMRKHAKMLKLTARWPLFALAHFAVFPFAVYKIFVITKTSATMGAAWARHYLPAGRLTYTLSNDSLRLNPKAYYSVVEWDPLEILQLTS